MNQPRKLKRTQERTFSAHHMLIRAASRANDAAAKKGAGWGLDVLATMTFSALAIEALCNSIGKCVVSDWKDFESASPNAKVRLLAHKLGVAYSKDAEPWSRARWLVTFRNLVAHAKLELVAEELLLTQEEHDKRLFDKPKSKLEKLLTFGNSSRALRAAEQLKDILVKKLSVEQKWGLAVDGWSGSTELHGDA